MQHGAEIAREFSVSMNPRQIIILEVAAALVKKKKIVAVIPGCSWK
jgi:hypothetical protein